MRKKKKKFSFKEFMSDAWLDLKFKLIILGSVFLAFVAVILLVVNDMQHDQELMESKANKYETYIDQLLMKKFSTEELKDMNSDELKLAVDMVIDEADNKVVNAPELKDFILPVEDDNYSITFELSRPDRSQWTQDELEEFWIDIESLDLQNLDENNFKYLKARLEDIR